MESSGERILYYWGGLQGSAQFARYVLEYIGIPYEQKLYVEEDEWFKKDKPNSTCVLPNLPNFKDGDVHISEHDAIMRYIARKYKPELQGKNASDFAYVEQFLCYLTKLHTSAMDLTYKPSVTQEDRDKFFTTHHANLDRLDKYLSGKTHFVGDYLTLADIYFYHLSHKIMLVNSEKFKEYKNLMAFADNIDSQEWVQNFKKSDKWIEQINGDEASINNKQ
eukprot:403340447